MSSTRNASGGTIQVGSPVALAGTGVVPADSTHPSVGIVLSGGPPGALISWADSGTVSRADWSQLTGASFLAPGSAYYVNGTGRLSTSGTQQVAVATSSLELAIAIHQNVPQLVQIHPVSAAPAPAMGAVGDLAYDGTKGNLWGPKTASGWPRLPNKLVTVSYDPNLSPIAATPTGNGWQVCS